MFWGFFCPKGNLHVTPVTTPLKRKTSNNSLSYIKRLSNAKYRETFLKITRDTPQQQKKTFKKDIICHFEFLEILFYSNS